MNYLDPNIDHSWKEILECEFNAEYFKELKKFLLEEQKSFKIFPPAAETFAAFNQTAFQEVRVVILGQDPYHGLGQANGLCFSVADGIPLPPSLRNIFKEIQDDLGYPIPRYGNLSHWARQGVLLLNTTLTVRAGQAGSHQKKGWERFTDQVLVKLAEQRTGLVFLLWGSSARAKVKLIDSNKHHVLLAPHPSPLSSYRGFFGCKHFSRTNAILKSQGLPMIDWQIKDPALLF